MNEHAPGLEYGQHGELRQAIGASGRVHLDRCLPYLVLHRSQTDGPSLARRIAVNSPAYLIWSPEDDAQASAVLAEVVAGIEQRLGSAPLIFTLADQPVSLESRKAPTLPRFVAEIAAASDADSQRAAARFEAAVRAISADLRACTVERGDQAGPAVPVAGERWLSVQLPSIHVRPDGEVYPQLEHELGVAFGDALLQAACAFVDNGKQQAPAHYRALGRRAFLAAACPPTASSARWRGASISCCRCRRSTPARRPSNSWPTRAR